MRSLNLSIRPVPLTLFGVCLLLSLFGGVMGNSFTVLAADSFKVAVVDPQAVIEKSKAGSRALAILKEHATARDNVLKSDQKELERLQEELKQAEGKLPEADVKRKQEAFAKKFQDYQKRGQEYQTELSQKAKRIGARIYEENPSGHQRRGKAARVFSRCG